MPNRKGHRFGREGSVYSDVGERVDDYIDSKAGLKKMGPRHREWGKRHDPVHSVAHCVKREKTLGKRIAAGVFALEHHIRDALIKKGKKK